MIFKGWSLALDTGKQWGNLDEIHPLTQTHRLFWLPTSDALGPKDLSQRGSPGPGTGTRFLRGLPGQRPKLPVACQNKPGSASPDENTLFR